MSTIATIFVDMRMTCAFDLINTDKSVQQTQISLISPCMNMILTLIPFEISSVHVPLTSATLYCDLPDNMMQLKSLRVLCTF